MHCEYCHRDNVAKADHLPYCNGLYQPWPLTAQTQKECKRRKGGCK